MSGSPSKRYRKKVKGIAAEMRACWNLDPQGVAGASPLDGPDGDPTQHGTFGNWSSSDENVGCCLPAPKASPTPSPVRFCLGPGSGAAPLAAPASPPACGWDSRIEEVMKREEIGSLPAALEGWPQDEQFWPTSAGRRIIADLIFLDGLGSKPAHQTLSGSVILPRALTLAGAELVPLEEFWTFNDLGVPWS